MDIAELLKKVVDAGASDLHMTTGIPPTMRLHGELRPMEGYPVIVPSTIDPIIDQITTPDQRERFERQGELDFSYGIAGVGRFRVNIFRQRGASAIVMRVINVAIPTFADLGLPPIIQQICNKRDGLVLVTGPTGSGKSTTLAAMVNYINETRSAVIITLEDPIEFLHKHKKGIINQREVGSDTKSFAAGLRAALREDPDVILLGEMRDMETMENALRAAETGHLVLSTLHTRGAAHSVDRIIDVFPPHQQSQIRAQLANALQAVISQQLVPRADGRGRVAALEIMTATPAVRTLIREGKTHQIDSVIETSAAAGMQTMDASLKQLFLSGIISREEYEARRRVS
ncbi:MAG: type IV pilus twitching motility protein PilT [Limnochordales bacterium]